MSIYGEGAFAIHHTFLISREVCNLAITPSGSGITLHAVCFLGSSSTQVLQSHVPQHIIHRGQCPVSSPHPGPHEHQAALAEKAKLALHSQALEMPDLQGAEAICEVSHLHFLLRW